MDFLNDKKNAAILIIVAVLLICGAIGSGIYFLGAGPAKLPPVTSTVQQPARPGYDGLPGPGSGLLRPGQ